MVSKIAIASAIIAVFVVVIFAGLISPKPFNGRPNEEFIDISNVIYVPASSTILVTFEYQGTNSNYSHNATIARAFLNDTDVTSNWASSKGDFTLSKGETTVIALIVPPLTSGQVYSVKLVTNVGTGCIKTLVV